MLPTVPVSYCSHFNDSIKSDMIIKPMQKKWEVPELWLLLEYLSK